MEDEPIIEAHTEAKKPTVAVKPASAVNPQAKPQLNPQAKPKKYIFPPISKLVKGSGN